MPITTVGASSDGTLLSDHPSLLWGLVVCHVPNSSNSHLMSCNSLLLRMIVAIARWFHDRFYCGARGICAGAPSAHNSDRPFDISCPLLLPPKVATGSMTWNDCCYWVMWHTRGFYSCHGARHCYGSYQHPRTCHVPTVAIVRWCHTTRRCCGCY
jgi:hypothetical protein